MKARFLYFFLDFSLIVLLLDLHVCAMHDCVLVFDVFSCYTHVLVCMRVPVIRMYESYVRKYA